MTLAAWLLTPALFVVLTSGVALGFERVSGARLPDGGLVPFGLCAIVVVALFGFWTGLHGVAVTAVVVVLALAGVVSVRGDIRAHLARRTGLLAFAGVYVLYMLPVIATGDWSWTGYNFVNDTAVQMLLADHLAGHALTGSAFDPATSSTASEVIRIYLLTDYPVGSHALLAVLDTLVPGQLAPLYQPYLAVLGGTAAMALSGILERAGVKRRWAALGGALAMSGNLTYQYALQGNLKEIALIATLAAAALVGDAVVRTRHLGLAAALGVCAAAMLSVYSAAGAPYLALVAVSVVVALVVHRVAWGWLGRALGVATVVLLLVGLPALLSLVSFGKVASGTFASAAAQQIDLGHLLRPLKAVQVAGVWLAEDYRTEVPAGRETLTAVLSALVLVMAAAGAAAAVRRRAHGALFVSVSVLLALAILTTRVSPYANGKLLAIASVGVMLLAALAIGTARGRVRPVALGVGGLILLGVTWSNALAYHGVKLAPTERMDSMRDISGRVAGRGLVLVNEPEEFAKFFLLPAQMNASTEAITPRQVILRVPQGFGNRYFDLDDQQLAYVQSFRWIVKRRSPWASRPPATFSRVYENAYYELWQRKGPADGVTEHLPLQERPGDLGRPSCRDVTSLGRKAGSDERLVAAVRERPLVLDTARAERAAGWRPHPYLPDTVITSTPGTARATVRVPRAGMYRAWVQGSFGRDIQVRVDDRRIGTAKGVDNLGQWHDAGELRLEPGVHRLELRRAGGGLAPGDGYLGELGPLVLEPTDGTRLETVAPQDARRLCGGTYDWIEAVRG